MWDQCVTAGWPVQTPTVINVKSMWDQCGINVGSMWEPVLLGSNAPFEHAMCQCEINVGIDVDRCGPSWFKAGSTGLNRFKHRVGNTYAYTLVFTSYTSIWFEPENVTLNRFKSMWDQCGTRCGSMWS